MLGEVEEEAKKLIQKWANMSTVSKIFFFSKNHHQKKMLQSVIHALFSKFTQYVQIRIRQMLSSIFFSYIINWKKASNSISFTKSDRLFLYTCLYFHTHAFLFSTKRSCSACYVNSVIEERKKSIKNRLFLFFLQLMDYCYTLNRSKLFH